ncbi:hypothetical protein Tco_0315685 [Tanacetum coccineum]
MFFNSAMGIHFLFCEIERKLFLILEHDSFTTEYMPFCCVTVSYHVLVNANALNRSIRFDNPVRGLNPLGPPCQTDILWLIVVDGWMGRNADIKDGAKIDVDHQLAERLQAQEQEEFSVEEKATLFQQLLEKRRKHFAAKRAEEKRNKQPTKAQQRKIMCTYLKNMEGYKLQDLKSKGFDSIQEMFDKAFKRVNTFEDFRTESVEGKEKRA